MVSPMAGWSVHGERTIFLSLQSGAKSAARSILSFDTAGARGKDNVIDYMITGCVTGAPGKQ
jgi:hypothetical protein